MEQKKRMDKRRHIIKLQTVFDLEDYSDLRFGRVMFNYDEKEDLREFTILSKGIPEEIRTKIKEYLDEHCDIHSLLDH